MCVASQISSAKVPSLNEIFRKYDVDGDGSLDVPELVMLLKRHGVGHSTAVRTAEAMDCDHSGTIEYTEFL